MFVFLYILQGIEPAMNWVLEHMGDSGKSSQYHLCEITPPFSHNKGLRVIASLHETNDKNLL